MQINSTLVSLRENKPEGRKLNALTWSHLQNRVDKRLETFPNSEVRWESVVQRKYACELPAANRRAPCTDEEQVTWWFNDNNDTIIDTNEPWLNEPWSGSRGSSWCPPPRNKKTHSLYPPPHPFYVAHAKSLWSGLVLWRPIPPAPPQKITNLNPRSDSVVPVVTQQVREIWQTKPL